jgi:hypothetical protein
MYACKGFPTHLSRKFFRIVGRALSNPLRREGRSQKTVPQIGSPFVCGITFTFNNLEETAERNSVITGTTKRKIRKMTGYHTEAISHCFWEEGLLEWAPSRSGV